jgi:glycogen(starch) synthase
MKYWLLTTEYPPFYGGGIGTYYHHTAKMLSEKGHEVSVFVPDYNINNDIIQFEGKIRIVRFSVRKTGSDYYLGFTAYVSYELAHTIREYLEMESKPDIVEVQDYQGFGYYMLLFKHLLYDHFIDLKVLITLHVTSQLCLKYNREPIYKFPTYWIGEMEKFSILASDIVISPSQYIIKRLGEDFRLEDKSIHVLPNPMGPWPSSGTTQGINKYEIIFLGKLVYLKGAFHLLEYFAHLWEKGFKHPLKIIGDGDFILHTEGVIARDYVVEKYGKYVEAGLLQLLGKHSQKEIGDRVSRAHVIIIPSLFDNLPYTVLEMMAAGKIVLASVQGGQVEIIEDGKDGFLFDHDKSETFYSKLDLILSLPETEIRRIGENARAKIANNYSPERIYEKKIRIIESYLEDKNRGREKDFPYIRASKAEEKFMDDPVPSYTRDLLSVVIPYYNMGEFIFDTIRSVKKSAYEKTEILVINDGSNDPFSLEALERIRELFPDVRLINKENEGLAHTRNFGAMKASGEFMAFLDADDTVEPGYYSKAIKVLRNRENVHYVGCWVNYFGNDKGIWPTFTPEPPYFLVHNSLNTSALVYKRASFLIGGSNDSSMSFQGYEDWESVISLIANGMHGVSIPEPLFNYRVRKGSMYRKINKVKTLYLHTYIVDKHKNLYSKFSADIINILNANGPGMSYDNPTLEYMQIENKVIPNRLINALKKIVKKSYILKKASIRIKKIME